MIEVIDDLLPLGIDARPYATVNGIKTDKPRLIVEHKMIVIHYVANPCTTARANRNYWLTSGTSAHMIIGMDGAKLRAVPENEQANHVGTFNGTSFSYKVLGEYANKHGLQNAYCIGVELCHPSWTGCYTKETLESLEEYIKCLTCRYPSIQWLCTHKDLTGKECDYWFNNNPDELDKLAEKFNLFTKRS